MADLASKRRRKTREGGKVSAEVFGEECGGRELLGVTRRFLEGYVYGLRVESARFRIAVPDLWA